MVNSTNRKRGGPEVRWANMTAPELRELQQRDAVVIVPVAATEQHGPHLPVKVDTLICEQLALRTARALVKRESVVVTPPMWIGLSDHHMEYGDTFSLDFATFLGVLRGICRSLVRHGFRRILLLNGHGGNSAALKVVVTELTQEFRVPLVTVDYWSLATERVEKILTKQDRVLHAGEAETSMVLALESESVASDLLVKARGPSSVEVWDFVGRAPYRWRSFASRSETDVIGDAETATAAKGEQLLSVVVEELTKILVSRQLWELPTWRDE